MYIFMCILHISGLRLKLPDILVKSQDILILITSHGPHNILSHSILPSILYLFTNCPPLPMHTISHSPELITTPFSLSMTRIHYSIHCNNLFSPNKSRNANKPDHRFAIFLKFTISLLFISMWKKAKVPDSRCGDAQHEERGAGHVHGCLARAPAELAKLDERPETPFVPRQFDWPIAVSKGAEMMSESPPHEGPTLGCDLQRFGFPEISVC